MSSDQILLNHTEYRNTMVHSLTMMAARAATGDGDPNAKFLEYHEPNSE